MANRQEIDAYNSKVKEIDGELVVTAPIDITGTLDVSGAVVVASTIESTQLKLTALNSAPANATDTGTLGEIRVVADFIYVCTATDVWVRAAIATW